MLRGAAGGRRARSSRPRTLLERAWDEQLDPLSNTRAHDGHDAAPQARRPAADRDGPRERLPRVIPNLRVRLTALYGGIFVVFVAVLLGVSYWLMARHLDRTLDAGRRRRRAGAARACSTCSRWPARRSSPAALGWALAGRELRSMQRAFDAPRALRGQRVATSCARPLTVIRTEADVDAGRPRRRRRASCARWARRDRARRTRWTRCSTGLMVLARSGRRAAARRDGRPGRGGRAPPRARARRAACACGCELEPARRARRAAAARAPGGQPDRERRPLQRAGRLRRVAHGRRATAAPCCDVVNSGPRAGPGVRRAAARAVRARRPHAATAAPASGSRSCAASPRPTAAASRCAAREAAGSTSTWSCRGLRRAGARGAAACAAGTGSRTYFGAAFCSMAASSSLVSTRVTPCDGEGEEQDARHHGRDGERASEHGEAGHAPS